MGFLGEVSRIGDQLVRPHDITIVQSREDGAHEAVVTRSTMLGFEVRIELMLSSGDSVSAQLTRSEADELELSSGDIVWLRTTGAQVLRAPGPVSGEDPLEPSGEAAAPA